MFPAGCVPAHVFHAGVMTGLEPLEEVGIARRRHGRCDSDVIEAQAQRFGLESDVRSWGHRGGWGRSEDWTE